MKLKALFGTVTFALKQYSPEILLGVGIIGVVGSTVMACKASLKATEIMEKYKEDKECIDDCIKLRETSEVDYDAQNEQHDRLALISATAGRYIRLYGPSATLMVVSVGCVLGSYKILKTRNVALMAAYKVLEEAFKKYRSFVIKDIGETADARLLYGEQESETEEKRVVKDKDGVEHEQTKVDLHLTGFARSFAPDKPDQNGSWLGSTQWSKVHEYNLDFLKFKENHFNNMLVIKGFVTINDVYEELGFAPTEAGMICGWRYKSDRGDGYISFKPREYDGGWNFGIDGDEILLDFNIDGVIFDQNVARKEMK